MIPLPGRGETVSGFTVTELGSIHMLGAATAEFYHPVSGTRLLYIQNDDSELGFNLIYRTPQTDETDTNHVLEHLILSSCKKYPSRDIFFDMDSKSYSTFMNGLTDNTFTGYPVCTQSQEQLLKLMDVYLCCMEDPDALKEKNFYLREGLRLELEQPEGPLTMQGTVLSEDFGHLTDIMENADSATAKALYPGQLSSNLLGRAHLHYRDLTYDRVRETFSRCYNYSNCLIILYGDMDYRAVLDFLDREHLSLVREPGRSLLPDMKQPASPGYRELTDKSPAYEGSPREQSSIIDYAIDLSDSTQEELIYWDLFVDILDSDTSPWHRIAREAGINNVMEVYLDLLLPSPSLRFRLRNGDEDQKELFRDCVLAALKEVSLTGVTPELYQAAMKENRLSDALTREGAHLGFNLSEEIGRYWSQTGKTDYFMLYESASGQFMEDHDQSILKMLAARALAPTASALVVTVPIPGMAEALEQEKGQYLSHLLSSMTWDEKEQLCSETKEFRKWNALDWGNMDFLIGPEDLPVPSPSAPFVKKHFGPVTSYTAPASVDAVGSYQIYFDLSRIAQEDLNFLSLYQMLLTELDTGRYTVEQQKNMEQEYLHDCTFDELYPGYEAGVNSRPMMTVFWYGLTEDFGKSLDFLMDIMGNSDYSDTQTIMQVLEKYIPDYDLSKADMAASLSFSLAEGYIRRECRFRNLLNSQEVYYFLKDVLKQLKQDPDYSQTVLTALGRVSDAILRGGPVTFMAAAAPESLEQIEQTAVRQLQALGCPAPDCPAHSCPTHDSPTHSCPATEKPLIMQTEMDMGRPEAAGDPILCSDPTLYSFAASYAPAVPYILPGQKQKIAVCVDAPSQETRMMGDFRGNLAFKGRYIPFLMACADKYLKPAIRYQGCAYDSGIDFYIPAGYFSLWSTADPMVRTTLEIFSNTGNALMDIPLTQQDLDGYILNAYAQALPPDGTLNSRMRYMRRDMAGIDTAQLNEMISDIKNARLEHRAEAAAVIQALLKDGPVVTVGNERDILKDKDCFDEVVIFRS